MADETMDMARLTKIYRKIRDAREKLKSEFNEQDRKLEEQLNDVEHLMLEVLKATGSDATKNEHGYVQRYVKTRYWSTDWAEFRKFAKENDALDLFESRIAQRNMEAWLKENPDKIPAGLNVDSRYKIRVIKPRNEE